MNEKLVESLSDLHNRKFKKKKRPQVVAYQNQKMPTDRQDAVTVVAYQNQKMYEEAGHHRTMFTHDDSAAS